MRLEDRSHTRGSPWRNRLPKLRTEFPAAGMNLSFVDSIEFVFHSTVVFDEKFQGPCVTTGDRPQTTGAIYND
jgi:hypothetical protein